MLMDIEQNNEIIERLAIMREPFDENLISKLPKPTKAQTDAVRNNFKEGIRCELCGGWHHKNVVHLDYVGHAALTDRLLKVDPLWNWEPVACDENGAPFVDSDGGMWIYLTVCGLTRRGYGDAGGKKGGNAMKERIGDALRNAAMRFGAALDLWHKGELHVTDNEEQGEQEKEKQHETVSLDKIETGIDWFLSKGKTVDQLDKWFESKAEYVSRMNDIDQKKAHGCYKQTREEMIEQMEEAPKTILCPASNGQMVVKSDCNECEINNVCAAMGNTPENKLEISI